MVAEQVLKYGLVVVVVRERQCDDSRMCVDCAWNVVAWLAARLRTRRKSLEFAEIRGRLQDAAVELVKLRQSVPKSPSEALVLRSGERLPPKVVRGKISWKRTDRRSRLNRTADYSTDR